MSVRITEQKLAFQRAGVLVEALTQGKVSGAKAFPQLQELESARRKLMSEEERAAEERAKVARSAQRFARYIMEGGK